MAKRVLGKRGWLTRAQVLAGSDWVLGVDGRLWAAFDGARARAERWIDRTEGALADLSDCFLAFSDGMVQGLGRLDARDCAGRSPKWRDRRAAPITIALSVERVEIAASHAIDKLEEQLGHPDPGWEARRGELVSRMVELRAKAQAIAAGLYPADPAPPNPEPAPQASGDEAMPELGLRLESLALGDPAAFKAEIQALRINNPWPLTDALCSVAANQADALAQLRRRAGSLEDDLRAAETDSRVMGAKLTVANSRLDRAKTELAAQNEPLSERLLRTIRAVPREIEQRSKLAASVWLRLEPLRLPDALRESLTQAVEDAAALWLDENDDLVKQRLGA